MSAVDFDRNDSIAIYGLAPKVGGPTVMSIPTLPEEMGRKGLSRGDVVCIHVDGRPCYVFNDIWQDTLNRINGWMNGATDLWEQQSNPDLAAFVDELRSSLAPRQASKRYRRIQGAEYALPERIQEGILEKGRVLRKGVDALHSKIAQGGAVVIPKRATQEVAIPRGCCGLKARKEASCHRGRTRT